MAGHNVSDIKYFTIEDILKAPVNTKTAFIIANERITSKGHVGRYYTIFPAFQEFLNNRNKYKHCHELLVDHKHNKPDLSGRLVFDFDIKTSCLQNDNIIPTKFKDQIEDIVVAVVEKYFVDVDTDKFEFIWSTSQNPKKFSKHLTVKNLCFDNWIYMSKTFYKLFCILWDEKYLWIKSCKLIDFQIVRNRASLRMVGSSKINGFPLIFDNEKHTLSDSLIRVYSEKDRKKEQIVTRKNIISYVFDCVIYENTDDISAEQSFKIGCYPKKIERPVYDKIVYEKAYHIYNVIHPNVFKMGKINGRTVTLIRKKPYKCLMSGRLHESENAFIRIHQDNGLYVIEFGCFRYCYRKKTICIGSISIDNLIVMIHPNFGPPAKATNKKRKILTV